MRRSFVAGFLAAAVLAASSLQASELLPRGIRWQANVSSAQRLSQQTHKPMLLVFGASWCMWCRKLEQTTLSDPRLGSYINSNFIPVHVDADRDPQLVQTLHADSLPTAVILSPDSDLLGRVSGYKDVAGYHSALATAVGRLPVSAPPNTILVQKNAGAPPQDPRPVQPGTYHKIYPTYPQFHVADRMPPSLVAAMPGAIPFNRLPGLAPLNASGIQAKGMVPAPPKPAPFQRLSPNDPLMRPMLGSS